MKHYRVDPGLLIQWDPLIIDDSVLESIIEQLNFEPLLARGIAEQLDLQEHVLVRLLVFVGQHVVQVDKALSEALGRGRAPEVELVGENQDVELKIYQIVSNELG